MEFFIKLSKNWAKGVFESKYLEIPHVLLAIIDQEHFLLEAMSIEGNENILLEGVKKICAQLEKSEGQELLMSKELTELMKRGGDALSPYDFLKMCLKETGYGLKLKELGLSEQVIENAENLYNSAFFKPDGGADDLIADENLSQSQKQGGISFFTDLSKAASRNELEECFDREEEISSCIEILHRKKKRNVLMLGKAGVGKTQIVEGLAMRMPDKKIYSIDVNKLVSGTKWRGDLENRLEQMMTVLREPDVIGFFDEAHMLKSFIGGDEGSQLLDLMKPDMARGSVQLILATTYDDYEKDLSPDKAFMRRCSILDVKELPRKSVLKIMRENCKKNNVTYYRGFLEEVYDICKISDPERAMPDFALEALDTMFSISKIEQLEEVKEKYEEKIGVNDKSIQASVDEGDFDNLIHLNKEKLYLTLQKKHALDLPIKLNIGERHLEKYKEKYLKTLDFSFESIKKLRRELNKEIVGRATVINEIVPLIAFSKSVSGAHIDPMLFYGPSGTGKLFAANKILEKMGSPILLLDGHLYKESHSAENLTGSPMGYKDHAKGGILSNFLTRNSEGCILISHFHVASDSFKDTIKKLIADKMMHDKRGNLCHLRRIFFLFIEDVNNKKNIGFDADNVNYVSETEKKLAPINIKKFEFQRIDFSHFVAHITKKINEIEREMGVLITDKDEILKMLNENQRYNGKSLGECEKIIEKDLKFNAWMKAKKGEKSMVSKKIFSDFFVK
jgi:ATP-dependent Clp protease ATP-binding subunit ClpA